VRERAAVPRFPERSPSISPSPCSPFTLPSGGHPGDYLILALIAERTKRERAYPLAIAIAVHDLRAARVILRRSRILTYRWPPEGERQTDRERKREGERERRSLPTLGTNGYHLEIVPRCQTCHVRSAKPSDGHNGCPARTRSVVLQVRPPLIIPEERRNDRVVRVVRASASRGR